MKKARLFTGIVLTVTAAGVLIYLLRKNRTKKMASVVADAGYETAYDIHYPLKHNRPKRTMRK